MFQKLALTAFISIASVNVTNASEKRVTDYLIENEVTEVAKESLSKIVETVFSLTKNKSFPKASDVLAIVEVESRFDPKASFNGNYGLMQINYTTHKEKVGEKKHLKEITKNLEVGISYLEELNKNYNIKVRSKLYNAYNVGPQAMRRGKINNAYIQKVIIAKAKYEKIIGEN